MAYAPSAAGPTLVKNGVKLATPGVWKKTLTSELAIIL